MPQSEGIPTLNLEGVLDIVVRELEQANPDVVMPGNVLATQVLDIFQAHHVTAPVALLAIALLFRSFIKNSLKDYDHALKAHQTTERVQ